MASSIINISTGSFVLSERTQVVEAYIRDIRKIPTLTSEEQLSLVKIYKNPTTSNSEKIKVRNKLIECNQRFIMGAARQYCNSNPDLYMELITEGNLGIIEALENYDVKRKQSPKFISWAAYYIRRSINQYLINKNVLVKKTYGQLTYHKISKIQSILTQKLERTPTEEEILEELDKQGITLKSVKDVMAVKSSSIDESVGDEESEAKNSVGDFARLTASFNDYEYQTEKNDIKYIVESILNKLTPIEKDILCMAFGLGEYNYEYSFEDIAKKYDYTKERIRQLYHAALKKGKLIHNRIKALSKN